LFLVRQYMLFQPLLLRLFLVLPLGVG